jgi:hypothetical protein
MSRATARFAAMLLAGAWLAGPASAADQAARNARLWVEAEIEPASPYVQAQALYTLRLYQAVGVQDVEFHAPRAQLADIRPIDDPQIGEVTRDGRRFRVTARRYAVFPFASGLLALSDGHVTGTVTVPGASPPATEALRLDPPATTLDVLAIPPGADRGAWLPARRLNISETWSPDPAEARVGQTLRRTIRIEAEGLDAAQLPVLAPGGEGFAAHPEVPRLDNYVADNWNVAIREQSWLIVPLRAGSLALPALQLPWWDVGAHRARNAIVPERQLMVAPAQPPADASTPAASPSGDTAAPAGTTKPAAAPTRPHTTLHSLIAFLPIAAALGAAVWLGFSLRRRTAAWRALREACRRGDPLAAQRALLRWAASRWPDSPPRSIGEVADRLPAPASGALGELDRRVYGPDCSPWDGAALLAGIRSAASASKVRTAALPPLYRD